MSIVLISNSLLNGLIIIFFGENNSFFIGDPIDYKVLLDLEEFQKHENDYNSCKIKYKE